MRTNGGTHSLIHRHSQKDLRRFVRGHGSDHGSAFAADDVRRSVFESDHDQAPATLRIGTRQSRMRHDGQLVIIETALSLRLRIRHGLKADEPSERHIVNEGLPRMRHDIDISHWNL